MTASMVSLMSGKGGSGKTTLALCFAGLVSLLGKRVLLVDCDLATHGLTYFFEHLLDSEQEFTPVTVFCQKTFNPDEAKVISANENIDLLPSIVSVGKQESYAQWECDDMVSGVLALYGEKYDLIVFDNQAGYSPMAQAVANLVSTKLFVLELDSVSTSANRVLYRRLCRDSRYSDSGSFQVVNKLGKEDREVFAKIQAGTLYENLPPVTFDWSVRRAFAECKVPVMGEHNARLTSEVIVLLERLVPILGKELSDYAVRVNERYLASLIAERGYRDKSRRSRKRFMLFLMLYALIIVLVCVALVLYSDLSVTHLHKDSWFVEISLALASCATAMGFVSGTIVIRNLRDRERRDSLAAKDAQLDELIEDVKDRLAGWARKPHDVKVDSRIHRGRRSGDGSD